MRDVRVVELAARQHNRFSRAQVHTLGIDASGIRHRLQTGRWTAVHVGVFGIAPVFDDDLGRWMAATLTDEGGVLSHTSAGTAWRIWHRPRPFEVVTRLGDGGPRRQDGLLVHRSTTVLADTTVLHGVPITTVPRTLLDLAAHVRIADLARAAREALRLGLTTATEITALLSTRHRGRRGARRLSLVLARYLGVPVERCRSAAEVEALVVLRNAGRPAPLVNVRIAGEEADLSWPAHRLVVEVDGPQFHLDGGEDARKQRIWEEAGWEVRRLPSTDVFERPGRLLDLAPPPAQRAERP